MSLIKTLQFRDSAFQPYLNTNTLHDVQTGVFIPGTHGGMILNGGLTSTNGYFGRQQMFKSTELTSHLMRTMSYYPRTETIIFDTETSLKKDRILRFSPYDNHKDLAERLVIQTPDMTAEEFFETVVKKIAKEKIEHREDWMVETPILDPQDGKPLRMMIPTFISYDSWSKMMSGSMQTILDTKVLGSSDTNIIYMRDGMVKKMIMSQIPTLAAKAGMYFMFSAHVGDKQEMNPYAHTPKSLQYMRHNEKPKEVGSDFNFLVSTVIEMRKVELLQDDKKECRYSTTGSSATELSEVTAIMLRCKNNYSGSQLAMVVSQALGIMGELSDYHYLRENEYFGLIGTKSTHKPVLTDISVSRNTIRDKLKDPTLGRALQIVAQLCYIQQNWMTVGSDVDFSLSVEKLAEQLLAQDGPTVSDILQSRGYWTYDTTNVQPYLSVYDVLAIAQGRYKAKGISLTGLHVPGVSEKSEPV